jgi:hypothetical protein
MTAYQKNISGNLSTAGWRFVRIMRSIKQSIAKARRQAVVAKQRRLNS